MAETERRLVPLADSLREAIKACELSYIDLGERSGVNAAQISRFMTGDRDLTLQVASRLCLVLGYGLVRQAERRQEKLPTDELPTTRSRPKNAPLPASVHHRGQGRRVGLRPEVMPASEVAPAAASNGDGDGEARPKRRRRRAAAAAASPAVEAVVEPAAAPKKKAGQGRKKKESK